MAARRNRYITFRLVGGPKAGNEYGIGATVILYGERRYLQDGNGGTDHHRQPHHQFREKSSHQHATDGLGSVDERITFGLGVDIYPLNVTVRWSNGHKTVIGLGSNWDFDPESYPILVGA